MSFALLFTFSNFYFLLSFFSLLHIYLEALISSSPNPAKATAASKTKQDSNICITSLWFHLLLCLGFVGSDSGHLGLEMETKHIPEVHCLNNLCWFGFVSVYTEAI